MERASTSPEVGRDAVAWSVERAMEHLLSRQDAEGWWCGELESNVTITAEQLLLLQLLEIPDGRRFEKIALYILREQREDGAWAIFYDGPGDLSTTIEAYFALKVAGVPADAPEMVRARQFVRERGGIPQARIFTKIWLALFGEYPWEGLPVMPPELIYLPRWFPFNIYGFASWARGTLVPIFIILSERPVFRVAEGCGVDELYPCAKSEVELRFPLRGRKLVSWETFFLWADRVLRLYERLPWKPGRARAVERVERWILEHQEADGSWGGIQPPWVYSLMALKTMGYSLDHPAMAAGVEGFERFSIENDESFRLQACMSPVWDTALAVLALREAGLPRDHPALLKAGRWLLKEQVTHSGGDWQVNVKDARPGGWAFEFDNDLYPDTDDTAVVMMALREIELSSRELERALERGLEWLLAMQSKNGGWGAFDRDNTRDFLVQIPFGDFGALLDPPSADVTAHVLELLGRMGYDREQPSVRRAVRYLMDEQEEDGAWFGRWGVNYVYGAGAVLPALEALGEEGRAEARSAVEWLVEHQNPDGGWGESCLSYTDMRWKGRGESTASQTAWALMALVAAGEAGHPACSRGVRFLVETQRSDGGWDEPYFTGTGFPGDFMINYHLYRIVFPLLALGRYRQCRPARGNEH